MKQRIDLQLIAAIGGGILFTLLFWMEKQALNLIIYTVFLIIITLLDQEKPKTKKLYIVAGSHLLAAILVVVNQSVLNIITWYISFAIMIGSIHFPLLRNIFSLLFAAFLQIITAPINLLKKIMAIHFRSLSFKPVLKIVKYIIIPLFTIILFSIVYSEANTFFADYLNQITSGISTAINKILIFLFPELSFGRFMHIVFGIILTAGAFISLKKIELEKIEAGFDEQLIRKRRNKTSKSIGYILIEVFAEGLLKRMMALKTENIIGIISFIALNLLLLSLNIIDIVTLWLGKHIESNGANYSNALHDGTNALILSIVMAMMVIVYFFRGNLNFYSKNKTIRLLAYLWIFQNIFLVCSVLLRDFHYINALGLTYKRIGVLVFLLLCTIGLTTVYIKVAQQKTFFYLCKINGFIWYILLLVFGFVNWDVFIVSYNINNRNSITLDLDHLTEMSDKTLPLLNKNKFILRKYLPTSNYAYKWSVDTTDLSNKRITPTHKEQILAFEKDLNQRNTSFKIKYNETSWLSWNFRDWQTMQFLIKNNL
nr:DUF4173 domain-containing protein [Pedobacter panaciterrae]